MVIRELYIVKIKIYILNKSLSALSVVKKDIIFITTYQKRERRKRLNRSKSNPKRLFNNYYCCPRSPTARVHVAVGGNII